MKVTPIKTRIVEAYSVSLTELLSESITSISENSVLAITSKVVSLCEGNVISEKGSSKDEIIEKESDLFLPKSESKYDVYLTIKRDLLIPSAGIDESNTNGYYVLWPKDPQASAELCWNFLKNRFGLKNLGVIITDSTTSPLRYGVTGKSIAYCGFKGIRNQIGEKDLFNRSLVMTRVNIADGLAGSAVLCMGESNEQTPMAVIEDVPFVEFTDSPLSQYEIEDMKINIEDDMYGQLLKAANWKSKKI